MDNAVVFHVFGFGITRTVVTTWGLMVLLAVLSWIGTRRLAMTPGRWQTVLEGAVESIDNAIRAVLPQPPPGLVALVGTFWIFIVFANLTGIIPGLSSPTEDLSLTSALALIVFASVHWFGIRANGLRGFLRQYLEPNPVMLPFHIISELSRTLSLAVRLFGNIMSLEMAALLVLIVGGLLVPVPVLMLHIVEALVQAYIFGMLALVYISGGIQSHQAVAQRRAATQ
ncbi:MAG: F0F1 ATP synthase subunit A [Nevskiales bacterium]|nr:F0F1 ATP synthase subunit A [Nevskiales bacterium]